LIFVCVGSREYQFDRLLKKIDELIEQGKITDKVFAQIGESNYVPKYYEYKRYLSEEEFKENQKKADLIISHAGTGALIGALKMGKKVIAVPRLKEYGEHIDDHQIQVARVLEQEGYLKCVLDMDELIYAIDSYKGNCTIKKYDKPSRIIDIIDEFITNG